MMDLITYLYNSETQKTQFQYFPFPFLFFFFLLFLKLEWKEEDAIHCSHGCQLIGTYDGLLSGLQHLAFVAVKNVSASVRSVHLIVFLYMRKRKLFRKI